MPNEFYKFNKNFDLSNPIKSFFAYAKNDFFIVEK